jgi:tRNA pseudouridine55 synthase
MAKLITSVNQAMRRTPPRRAVHGILLLDKPGGITSNRALQIVKRLFNADKAGHTGSLDPMATGMLPICLGEATKISGYLLDAAKRYRFTARLGARTDTGDADGQVIAEYPLPELEPARIESVFARFLGKIQQIPPMYSALHYNGKRLYELARQGQEVEREARTVEIFALQLEAWQADGLTVDVVCSKGTYVRTLADDLAHALGCGGAYLTELRRLSVAGFESHTMHTLSALEQLASSHAVELDTLLLPMELALTHWPNIQLDHDAAMAVRHGQSVWVPNSPPVESWVTLFDNHMQFIGMAIVDVGGRIAPKRLVQMD